MQNPLLEPFEINSLKLKNRTVMAPMTRSFSPGHVPGPNVAEYYARRAAGGVGLIITEGTNINHSASAGYPNVPVIFGEKALAGWEKVTEAVHKEGGKIACQLWHVGCVRSPEFDPDQQIPSMGPSGILYTPPGFLNHSVHEMTLAEVEEVIAAFAEGAAMAKKVGFDAIEIHGAHGYLIDQFFWDVTNKRTDRFGGATLADRTTFAVEIIKACREKLGVDFPIIFRFSNWKLASYEQHLFKNPEDLKAFLEPLKNAGVDIFHASSRNFDLPEFEGSHLNLAGWTKKFTQRPTISVGSVGLEEDFIQSFKESKANVSIENLIDRLSHNEFDLIAIGRALIGDPNWVQKIIENRFDEIKPYTKECLTQLY
ncbi:MAG: NADH:flavin oxidoreductase [Bdellovibrionales bacterium]